MQERKPLILISNDDGITSKGIAHLVHLMKEIGDVIVVAPNSPQSGMGHAITINEPLRYYRSDIFDGVEAYETSGTPADCVKLAKNHILQGRVPDLVVSGINHGSNTSVSVLYSGTMSAALEASIEDLPSIGFSLCEYGMDADFSHTSEHILSIVKQSLESGLPKGVSFNVNFPRNSEEGLKGVKICRQAKAKWQEEFDERKDPSGRRYLWLTGYFVDLDGGDDTDAWAIENNYVSIVPVRTDMTSYEALDILNKNWRF